MRKHFKFLIPAILVVALIVSCAVIFASAEDKVVYVSSTGAAPAGVTLPDGAVIVGPGTVTGTVTVAGGDVPTITFDNVPYAEAVAQIKAAKGTKFVPSGDVLTKASPLYKAIEAVGEGNTGTIVILDEIAIEIGDRIENGSAAEHKLPKVGTVTLTTNDGTTDYAAKTGAKLVLDHSVWSSMNVQLLGKMTLKNINLEYRYNSASSFGSWEKGFNFYTSCNAFTVDEGVTVTSFDYKTGSPVAGDWYPNIFGGLRYAKLSTGTAYITIKSGTWGKVFGAGHGMDGTNTGEVKAATITVEGGKVTEINGVGSSISGRAHATVLNDLTINVTGGEVGTITAETAKGVGGALAITVAKPANVEKIVASDNVTKTLNPTSVAVTYDEGYVGEVTGFEASEVTKNANVVYVATAGTGDGKTDATPMGHGKVTGTLLKSGVEYKTYTDADYATVIADMKAGGAAAYTMSGNAFMKANVFYRAVQALGGKSGTIVLVGPTNIDAAERIQNDSPSEMVLPVNSGVITVTSTYGGKDYSLAANGGAKLVLDRSNWNSINLDIQSDMVWKDLTVEHSQYSGYSTASKWPANFGIFCRGYDFTVENVRTTSWDAKNNKAGGSYAYIFAGRRYAKVTVPGDGTQDIKVSSGTWHGIFAAGCGMSGTNDGVLTGNVNITINETKTGNYYDTNIVQVNAGGFTARSIAGVKGNVTINVNAGARVQNQIYAQSAAGVSGKVVINVAKDADIRSTFKGVYYTDGTAHTLTPTGVELNFYTTIIPETKVFNVADFEATGNVYNPIDKAPTPPPASGGTPAVTGDEKVIYIAAESKGTGDGSSAENAMGHDADYATIVASGTVDQKKTLHTKHAFTKAITANSAEIVKNGGVIVIVGDIAFESGDGYRDSLSEFRWLAITGTKNITITSYYNGVDYRLDANGGANVVFDTSKAGMNVEFKAPTTLEYLNIEAKFDSSRSYGKYDDGIAALSANGCKFVVDEEVVVTSNDVRASGTKIEKYPAIFGYARLGAKGADAATEANPDITINSGKWGKIYGSNYGGLVGGTTPYGNLKGNVTITINGGSVEQLCGTSRVDYTVITAKVTGNVTINVNGGTIGNLYGTNHSGIDGKITVNVAEAAKITGKAYAYSQLSDSSNTANKPADSTINYHRQAIADENVLYWTNAVGTGEASGPVTPPPAPSTSVIYIAANGTGDGSAPDKPLGNVANYNNQNYQDNLFYRAVAELSNGGTIVVVGDVVLDTAGSRVPTQEGQGLSPSELTLPKANGLITVTSVYGGVDYRANAKLVLDADKCNTMIMYLQSAMTFENLNIEHKYDPNDTNNWNVPVGIGGNGSELIIGEGVKVTSLNADTNAEGNQYPMLLGGHRFSSNNLKNGTKLTIKSGKWSTVIGGSISMGKNYPGDVTGDVVINVMGGSIDTIYGNSGTSAAYTTPYCSVSGTIYINVTGGKVGALYGANSNGAEGDIIVNIADTAERVNLAWAYPGTGKAPANAAITYDRSVIRDDEVKYWNNITVTGDLADQPEKNYYTVYVADEARGKGDGSSPENAIGASADYRAKYNRMVELLAIPAKERTEDQTAEFNSYKNLYKESALYRALNDSTLVSQGGKLVIVGPVTVDANDSLAAADSNGDFQWPLSGGGQVIITSVDKGVDYREQGAKLVIDRTYIGVSFAVKTPTLWEKLNIEYKYTSAKSTGAGTHTMICLQCNEGIFGEEIVITPVDSNTTPSKFYPGIIGGHRFSDKNGDTNVVIMSGRWGTCYGGNYGRAAAQKDKDGNTVKDANNATVYDSYGYMEGNVNFTVTGGKVTAIIGTCRDDTANCKATVTGNVNINISGDAEVVKLYGANRNGVNGKITVNVTENAYAGTA